MLANLGKLLSITIHQNILPDHLCQAGKSVIKVSARLSCITSREKLLLQLITAIDKLPVAGDMSLFGENGTSGTSGKEKLLWSCGPMIFLFFR